MTKKAAREQIKRFKDETNYFSGTIKLDDMRDMFRNRMGFGEAETEVILSALTIAGAKFQEEEKEVSEAWKKEKARKQRKAQRLSEEMDQAIEAGDDEGFQKAFQETLDCMKAKERGVYFRKYLAERRSRRARERRAGSCS